MSGTGGIPVEELHRSIGEVLALLRDEFPDVTISKIRFLESQGLVDPERTPSGYRRFYDKDIDRLRWILRQQREHYLPLKVIKDRLEGSPAETTGPAGLAAAPVAERPVAAANPDARTNGLSAADSPRVEVDLTDGGAVRRVLPEPSLFAARPASSEPGSAPAPPVHSPPPSPAAPSASPAAAAPSSMVSPAAAPHAPVRPARSGAEDLTSVSLTTQELADATGMRVSDIADLERFGLIAHRTAGSVVVYDGDALVIARLAAGFRAHGLEARHLRMFKVAADREAALFEQVVLPLARQRTVEARRALHDTLTDLSRLTDSLHSLLLQASLRALD